jgi:hypothetical protein
VSDPGFDISIVCRAGREAGDLVAMQREYAALLEPTGRRVEFLFVLERSCPQDDAALAATHRDEMPVRVFRTARDFGESATMQHGFDHSRGRYVFTIPDHTEVDPRGFLDVLARLDEGNEVVVTRREPRRGPFLARLQLKAFHMLVRVMTGGPGFSDLTCGLRGMTARAARALDLYGDYFHRFIPVLSRRRGFRTIEIPVTQRTAERPRRLFRPGIYTRRLLDILNVFFLSGFARKPLQFFGATGAILALAGGVICLVLGLQRILRLSALSHRPLLLLGVLLVVLGVQLASMGLLGELIIFFSGRRERPEVTELKRDEASRRVGSGLQS